VESQSLVGTVAAPEDRIEVRPLRTHQDFAACVELQRITWGAEYNEVVPPIILKITQKVGGVAAGAFDETGRMLGCVYGITGVENGRLVHWSHMLAVLPEARNSGIGRRLKEYQRDRLLPLGVELMYWTFDPLVARNAHFNLVRLGAEVTEYVVDMYGRTGSVLHVLGTDRFVAAWRLNGGSRSGDVVSGASPVEGADLAAPIANRGPDGGPAPESQPLPSAPLVRIEIPEDIEAVRDSSLEEAKRWQKSVQRAFLWYLGAGYKVIDFRRAREAGRCHYLLAAPANGASANEAAR